MKLEKTGIHKVGNLDHSKVILDSERTNHESKKMTRRGFLRRLATVGGAAALAPKFFEVALDSLKEYSDSAYFDQIVEMYAEKYEPELDFIAEYSTKITVGDEEGRTRLEYVSEELEIDGVSEIISHEIKKYVSGLCLEESRFDASRKSPAGAMGMMQIMPATWKEHGSSDANPLSLVAQVDAAGSLLSQSYRYLDTECKDEFKAIEAEFFHGDTDAFEKYFMVPVLINSYNAGAGNMKKIVQWFARVYGSEESTVGALGQKELLSGYDVFLAMSQKGFSESPVKRYGEHASQYTSKVYGATQCLEENRNKIRKV